MILVDVFDQLAFVAERVRKCPTPTLQRAYIRAYRDWCEGSQWLRVDVTGTTEPNVPLYSLGDDPYLEIIGVFAMSANQVVGGFTQVWPVTPSNSGTWDANMPPNLPVRYTYVPEGQIALNPTPNKAVGILTTAIVQPKDGVTKVPSNPLKKWSSEIEAGALENLLSMRTTSWYDPGEAVRYGREFASGISNAKAEVQRSFNTGSQRAVPRRFLF